MTLKLGELADAFPLEAEAEPTPQEALRELLAGLSTQAVPVGAFRRLWTLGTLQAKIALAYLAYWIRSAYGDVDENTRRLNETHLRAAIQLLGGMSYLRGAIMKVGQTLANYPNVVPGEFVDTLSRLHFDAPPMHYSLLREHLVNELGKPPEELFAGFEPRAFAAASLGQVHRARLKSGEFVAVKVQYPNIARTIRDDFRNLSAVLLPMRLHRDWESVKTQFEDLREMLERETDYRREAELQFQARRCFGEGDGIVVPRVFEDISTSRVLTMEYFDGVHLDRFLAGNPSQAQRDLYGTHVMRSSFRLYAHRVCYADPHPGNYLFLPEGRLGLIDFGCCRTLTDADHEYSELVDKATREGGEAMRKAMMLSASLPEGRNVPKEHLELFAEFVHWFNDCLAQDSPFDFGDDDFMRRGFKLFAEFPRIGYVRSQPVDTWIFRALLGVRAICYRLRARVNMHTLHLEGREEAARFEQARQSSRSASGHGERRLNGGQ